jgi:hypothetical protein
MTNSVATPGDDFLGKAASQVVRMDGELRRETLGPAIVLAV